MKRQEKRIRAAMRGAFWLGVLLLMSGCASVYTIRVDGLADTDAVEAKGAPSYVLGSLFPEEGGSDLMYKETAGYVRTMLATHGYREVADPAEADLLVEFAASISDPVPGSVRRSDPIYVRTWGQRYYVRTPVYNDQGNVVRYVTHHYYDPPRTEFAGYVDRDVPTAFYEKRLDLLASRITEAGEAGDEVWKLTAARTDASTDLRAFLPYLAAAAEPYVGERTPSEIRVDIKDGDPRLEPYR